MKRIALIVIFVLVLGAVVVFFGHRGSSLISSPSACVNNTFAEGANGHCVSDLQNLLNWSLYGIDQPNYQSVSGTFSASTKNSVDKFQESNNLSQTGSLNKQTWQALCSGGSDATPIWTAAAKDAGCKL